jgi:hypothetical protein
MGYEITQGKCGNLTAMKRKKEPNVWQFRWPEKGKLKSVLIGTVEKLATHADAERAVDTISTSNVEL